MANDSVAPVLEPHQFLASRRLVVMAITLLVTSFPHHLRAFRITTQVQVFAHYRRLQHFLGTIYDASIRQLECDQLKLMSEGTETAKTEIGYQAGSFSH